MTFNKQYILKTLTKSETKFLLRILQSYMEHLRRYPHSILVKFLGLYRIKVRKFQKPLYFVVMMNIFYPDERLERRYDIKGCRVGRFTKLPHQRSADVIRKEQNLENAEKLHFGNQRQWLLTQVGLDSEFLRSKSVLDYSLLIGVQQLHDDEKDSTFASVVARATKSTSTKHSLFKRAYSRDYIPTSTAVDVATSSGYVTLPGAIVHQPAGCSGNDDVKQKLRHMSVTSEQAVKQNRRLLPSYHKNELHILDTEADRFYVGIIDFLTRYTTKKKMENAYKRLIHPSLSFSTVPPDIYALRFRNYISDNST